MKRIKFKNFCIFCLTFDLDGRKFYGVVMTAIINVDTDGFVEKRIQLTEEKEDDSLILYVEIDW